MYKFSVLLSGLCFAGLAYSADHTNVAISFDDSKNLTSYAIYYADGNSCEIDVPSNAQRFPVFNKGQGPIIAKESLTLDRNRNLCFLGTWSVADVDGTNAVEQTYTMRSNPKSVKNVTSADGSIDVHWYKDDDAANSWSAVAANDKTMEVKSNATKGYDVRIYAVEDSATNCDKLGAAVSPGMAVSAGATVDVPFDSALLGKQFCFRIRAGTLTTDHGPETYKENYYVNFKNRETFFYVEQ